MAEASFLAGRNILLVEDEMMVTILLESEIKKAGAAVISCGHVEQATILAKEREIDAAVLDVNLHGKRSYPVADILIERKIPFVFSTGYGDVDLLKLYPDHPVLAKPYKPTELISALCSAVA